MGTGGVEKYIGKKGGQFRNETKDKERKEKINISFFSLSFFLLLFFFE